MMSIVEKTEIRTDENRESWEIGGNILDLDNIEVQLSGQESDQVETILFQDINFDFSTTTCTLMPDVEKRREWVKSNNGEIFPEDIKFNREIMSRYTIIDDNLSDEEIKLIILQYLHNFPYSWTGDIIRAFNIDVDRILNNLEILQSEKKIKPRSG